MYLRGQKNRISVESSKMKRDLKEGSRAEGENSREERFWWSRFSWVEGNECAQTDALCVCFCSSSLSCVRLCRVGGERLLCVRLRMWL